MQVEALFELVAQEAPPVFACGNHLDLCMLLWSFARLELTAHESTQQLLEDVSAFGHKVLYNGDLSAIAQCFWAYARLATRTRSVQVCVPVNSMRSAASLALQTAALSGAFKHCVHFCAPLHVCYMLHGRISMVPPSGLYDFMHAGLASSLGCLSKKLLWPCEFRSML